MKTHTAIVGAGPYGLSIAAHLRRKGVPFRIFGRPMDTWINHMPKGMLLKSDGFASNLDDPDGDYTLEQFCRESSIPYGDTNCPIRLETFSSYGVAFQKRKLPELDKRTVTEVKAAGTGFVLGLEDGETVEATRVVLAVGVTHFENVPEILTKLPAEFSSHSARHTEPETWRGRSVVVVGAGASALDLAALLHDAGADVHLVARKSELKFHSKAVGKRTFWQRVRRPSSGLGPGWKSYFFANMPWAFHYLPQGLRLEAVRRVLGPSGGMYIRDKVMGVVPQHLGCQIEDAQVRDGKVHLKLVNEAGEREALVTEHVIAATGYRVEIERLSFLAPELLSRVRVVNGAPVLSAHFESSIAGLYFVGLAAANSFGPVMRFAYGAAFTARTVSNAITKTLPRAALQASVATSAAASR
jgi:cation diffusion facilitator CzcD-associated flavoprotein CzcO